MGKNQTVVAAGVLFLASACGGSGGGGVSAPPIEVAGASYTSHLTLVGTSPADGSTQVDPAQPLRFQLDGAVTLQSLFDQDTWLRITGDDQDIAGVFAHGADTGQVVFTPSQPLRAATSYTFQFSPLTTDSGWRVLEQAEQVTFRTLDNEPPRVAPAASTLDGSLSVGRTAPLQVLFSEELSAATVSTATVELRDGSNQSWPIEVALDGAALSVCPKVYLPGSQAFTLRVTGGSGGVMDTVGNPLTSSWEATFSTEADAAGPAVMDAFPALTGVTSGVSPQAALRITFDDSIDIATAAAAIDLLDPSSGSVAHTLTWSIDQRTVAVVPNAALSGMGTFTLQVGTGLLDISGVALASPLSASFTLGGDVGAPQVQATRPVHGESRATPHALLEADLTEALDGDSVAGTSVHCTTAGGDPVQGAIQLANSNRRVVFTPTAPLVIDTDYVFTVKGGPLGVRDLAGNPLANDSVVTFRTSSDSTDPSFVSSPLHGLSSLPWNTKATLRFATPLDPSTVDAARVTTRLDSTAVVPATVTLSDDRLAIVVTPTGGWPQGAWCNLTVMGGPNGIRTATGNWLVADELVRFHTTGSSDVTAPNASVTLNGIPAPRNENLTLPPRGFTVDVTATDLYGAVDMASVELRFSPPSGVSAPSDADIAAGLAFGTDRISWQIPHGADLEVGDWTLDVIVRDLAGNLADVPTMAFRVAPADAAVLPFERTQLCHVRFDLDRDGNGRADFEDELMLLGLIAAGDPLGTNARMIQLMQDGVLARMNTIFHRTADGNPLGADSVPVRLITRAPVGVAAMSIHIGGFEPGGAPGRTYGDESTGILGRAWYDYRNANPADDNTGLSPALGVFGAELYLYQAKLHSQVYPYYSTTFGNRFVHLSPPMGGTAAGLHAQDPAVLDPGFQFTDGSAAQQTRYQLVMLAADDWCAAIGTIGAHEIAHSLGLVAPGTNPTGLFGDGTLHNSSSALGDVMAAAVSYSTMVTSDFRFRPLNLAYLRQRILLR